MYSCLYPALEVLMLLFVLHSTIVVEPGCTATITEYGDIEIVVCHKDDNVWT